MSGNTGSRRPTAPRPTTATRTPPHRAVSREDTKDDNKPTGKPGKLPAENHPR